MANVDCRISRALQSYTITYPAPDETLLGTPEALPTTEPTDPQISYTVAAGHLPTVSPAGLEYTLTAILYAAGKNTDAASQTVYYRILKNGANVATGSASVAANTFYTWSHYNFYDVQVGDVLACKLWASAATVNWDYKALAVLVTRIGPANRLLHAVQTASAAYPVLTQGLPSALTNSHRVWHNDTHYATYTVGAAFDYMLPKPTYRLIQITLSDRAQQSVCLTSATDRPRYYSQYAITALSFRPLTLRV